MPTETSESALRGQETGLDDRETSYSAAPAQAPFLAGAHDYSFVAATACIASYDDLRSTPRIIRIDPAPTAEYIETLTTKIYEQAKAAGGSVPYTVIREVSENFIHAQFREIVVSILNKGNTIRFSDQGPGIAQKDKAQLPGFSSATAPMKDYIRGVGSGLPIVKEYLDYSKGSISIEDNLKSGAVVTINLLGQAPAQPEKPSARPLVPPLNSREREFLDFFNKEGALGVTDLVRLTGAPQSSTFVALSKLAEYGLVEKTVGQKRILTELGYKIANASK